MNDLTLSMTATPNANLNQAVMDAIRIADTLGCDVEITFHGTPLTVNGQSKLKRIVEIYNARRGEL